MKKLIVLSLVFLIAAAPLQAIDFFPAVDAGVSCPAYPPLLEDVGLTYSAGLWNLKANVLQKPGLFMNAIASHPLAFEERQRIVSGYWRNNVGSKAEGLEVNLQLVENYEERSAEIIWSLNPWSPLYGWVWTRGDDFVPIKLFQITPNNSWHYFRLTVDYPARKIKTIQVDNKTAVLNLDMLSIPKEWESSYFFMLETTNMYTNCSDAYNFTGSTSWKGFWIN